MLVDGIIYSPVERQDDESVCRKKKARKYVRLVRACRVSLVAIINMGLLRPIIITHLSFLSQASYNIFSLIVHDYC